MDLVDEQHIARLQIGQQRGQVAGRSSTGPEVLASGNAHFAGDDVRQRGLAQPRRAKDQRVVERLASVAARGG
jgi:hypothetical protein